MALKAELLSDLLSKVALAVASAAVVGGGSLLLKSKTDLATHDLRIQRLEQTVEKIDTLSGKLDNTNANLMILNAKMEAKEAYESRK